MARNERDEKPEYGFNFGATKSEHVEEDLIQVDEEEDQPITDMNEFQAQNSRLRIDSTSRGEEMKQEATSLIIKCYNNLAACIVNGPPRQKDDYMRAVYYCDKIMASMSKTSKGNVLVMCNGYEMRKAYSNSVKTVQNWRCVRICGGRATSKYGSTEDLMQKKSHTCRRSQSNFQVLDFEPDNDKAIFRKGCALQKAEKYEKAVEEFQKCKNNSQAAAATEECRMKTVEERKKRDATIRANFAKAHAAEQGNAEARNGHAGTNGNIRQ